MDTQSQISKRRRYKKKFTMMDPRWTIKDKVRLYKGITRLHSRQKKIKALRMSKLRKKTRKTLKTLKEDVNKYRGVLTEVQCGDKRRLHTILRDHKDLQLAYEDRNPGTAYNAVFNECEFKQQQLNELVNCKRIKTNEFLDLKVEWVRLSNEYENQNALKDPDYQQQKILYLYDKTLANKRTAESMRLINLFMIDVLEKDRSYFNAIIDGLEADKKEQHQLTTKATYMGQLASEDLNDTRQIYKRMTSEVWKKMQQRQRTLKIIRKRVENLWSDMKQLIRIESDSDAQSIEINKKRMTDDENLEEEIQSLEKIFDQLKVVLLTRSYNEFLTRFEAQARQKTRLQKLLDESLEKRDLLLNKKNNAVLILEQVKDSIKATDGDYDKYKSTKNEMLNRLEIEKKREIDFKKIRESHGALLINVKSALLNMIGMMVCVKPSWARKQKLSKDKRTRDKKQRYSVAKLTDKSQLRKSNLRLLSEDECQLEKVDTDVLNLLAQVSRKATILLMVTQNIELNSEEMEKAKINYQIYVADQRSKALLKKENESEIKLPKLWEEMIDTRLITRKEIKNRSKRIVEAHIRMD